MKIKLFTWGFIIGSFCFFYGLMYHNLNLKLEQLSQEKNREMQKVELLKDNWLKNIFVSNVKFSAFFRLKLFPLPVNISDSRRFRPRL